jgi:hypothetical protein
VLVAACAEQHQHQSSAANAVDEVWALEGVCAEHEAIKREFAVLRQLVETKTISDGKQEEEEEFGHVDDDDDTRSIRTVAPHELERVEEEDEDQLARQEDDEEEDRRRQRGELGRPRTPEPMGTGMNVS